MHLTPERALLAVLVLLIAGCGASDDGPTAQPGGGEPATTLRVSADPGGGLRFDARSLSASAGTVAIEMANPSAVPHAVGIKGGGLDEQGKTVGRDGVSTAIAELEPGLYSFYCPVGSHEAAGMRGELRVR